MTPFDGSGLHIRTRHGPARSEKWPTTVGARRAISTTNREAKQARITQVKAMFQQGLRGWQIAAELKMPKNTVYTYKLKGELHA